MNSVGLKSQPESTDDPLVKNTSGFVQRFCVIHLTGDGEHNFPQQPEKKKQLPQKKRLTSESKNILEKNAAEY